MRKRKLGILLSTSPDHQNLKTVLGLAKEALQLNIDTYLYLLDDGVKTLGHPEIKALSKTGIKLFACAYGAQQRNIPVSDDAVFCGLVVLSDLIKGCDRFITFN